MMERKFARLFHRLVQELIPDNGHRDQLFDALRKYQSSQKLHELLLDLRQILDEPDKLELFEFIRPLILLRHQMEYSYLTPPAPGVKLRTIRLNRSPNQSLGFAVRGGYEFSVGVFVSKVEPGTQAEKQGLKVGDEIVRVNGFTIAEAIHDDVLNLIKSREEIVLKVTHIGMLPVKERVSDNVTWQYVEDMDSKRALDEVLSEKQVHGGKGVELKIFIDCNGYDSIGCGILSGPHYYPGIFVEKVRPGSLAQEVGLEVGDQIVEVNDSVFQNIGHKEASTDDTQRGHAVVVLKGSKQLNVIIRKHAGLPLFDRRQTPSRDSSAAGSSHRPGSSSPPASHRSIPSSRPSADHDNRLDEDQLIAEQLSRGASLQKATTTTTTAYSSLARQTSSDSHVISTQAEVHSDSDSYHGSAGDGPPVPIEEVANKSNTTATASEHTAFPPPTTTLPTTPPASLSTPSSFTSSTTHEALSLPLPDKLDAATASGNSAYHPPTTTTTATITDTTPLTLSLPDDLGDPVLAALRRPIYPSDIPPWVVPRMYVSDLHPGIALMGGIHNAETSENGNSLVVGEKREGKAEVDQETDTLGGGGLGESSGQVTPVFKPGQSGNVKTLVHSMGEKREGKTYQDAHVLGDGLDAGSRATPQVFQDGVIEELEVEQDQEEVLSHKDGEVKTAENGAQSEVPQMDENSNIMKFGHQLSSDSQSHGDVPVIVGGSKEGDNNTLERSDLPVFVPPPPPSFPPPPALFEDHPGRILRASPTPSRHSSISTQNVQLEKGDIQLEDTFEAVVEFGSESDESGHSDGETETGEIKDEAELGSQRKGDDPLAESFTGRDASGTSLSLSAGAGTGSQHNSAEFSKGLSKFSPASGCSLKRSEEKKPRGEVDVVTVDDGVDLQEESVESGQEVNRARSEVAGVTDPNLLPPSASFWTEESNNDNKDTIAPFPTGTHTDVTTTFNDRQKTFSPKNNATAQSPDPSYPPPTQTTTPPLPSPPSPVPPPLPPPSFCGVLGGAAAVLATRREAREEERWSPRLLGPAEPSLSGGGGRQALLGGVVGFHPCLQHRWAALFNPLELDGRELKAFSFPKGQSLGVALEGGTGTPLAGRIVVAAVFGSGAAVENGLQTGDQLMMVNAQKLTDISVAEAEQILERAYSGPKDTIQVVYAQSNFLNDEECVTYF
ncbi:hypothetical protein ACOMHN_001259 [Nucella lapillus]